jgi:hypothetical protein
LCFALRHFPSHHLPSLFLSSTMVELDKLNSHVV